MDKAVDTGDNKALVVGEFFSEKSRDDHFCEAEEPDLFLNTSATQHPATDQLVSKVHLQQQQQLLQQLLLLQLHCVSKNTTIFIL